MHPPVGHYGTVSHYCLSAFELWNRKMYSLREAAKCGHPAGWQASVARLMAGLITFYSFSILDRLRNPVLLFDGAGLALFAVSGTQKALSFGLNPVMAALLGMLTGIGGGMVRDILLAEIPTVLRADLYAVAALAGATVVVIGNLMGVSSIAATLVGGALCFGLRIMAIQYGWHLPVARPGKR